MRFLKQSTSVDVKIGPFLDETDGKTVETALTITQPDIRLAKNGGAWAQKNAAQTLSHEEAGWYEVTLDATDTDTLGILMVAVHESGALPVWVEFMVLPANVYDSMFSTDKLQVDAVEISGDSAAADNLESEFDGTGFKSYVRRNTAQAGAAGTITLDASASATNDLYNGMMVAIVSGTGVGQARFIKDYVGATKVATIAPNWITNPDATSVFVILPMASVWEALTAELATASTIGKLIVDNLNATVSSRASQTSVDTVDDFLDTEIAAIKAVTDVLLGKIDAINYNKNTAYSNYMFLMVDDTDGKTPETGLTPTCTRSIDGAAFAACANSPVEVSNGWYKITLAASDLNGDEIVLRFTGTGSRAWLHKIRTINA